MADIDTAGTANEQPADDLRSALANAVAESEKAAAPTPAEKPPKTEATDAGEAKTARGPDGKFIKKDAAAEGEVAEGGPKDGEVTDAAAAEKPEGEQAEADGEKPEGDKPEDKHADFTKPWKAADREMFAKLAPEAQDFLARRYKEMEGDYTKKLQANARLRTEYEPVDKLFEPYRDTMKQKGFTPAGLIEAWANVEKKLISGEQGALEVISGLVRGYNVPVAKLAAALGIRAGAAPAAPAEKTPDNPQGGTQIQLPPEVVERLQKLDRLEQSVNGLTAAQNAARQAALNAGAERAQQEIENFKSEKGKDGALLRPHFDDVEADMIALANAAIASKQPVPSLSELYEKAVWSNPATREKLLTAQTQAAEAKRIAQEKAKAAAAKKASTSVTGAPGLGQATSPRTQVEQTLREQLMAAAEEAEAAA